MQLSAMSRVETKTQLSELSPLFDVLLRRYGVLLRPAEAAHLLGYNSTASLAQARRCGRLQVRMFRVPGRRGWHADTGEVAAWLSRLPVDQRRNAAMS